MVARPKLSRERIVSAANAALTSGGHEAVVLRAIARDLGVTAPALYDHFDSRDDLLRSLAEHGYLVLAEALRVDGERAIDRVRRRALAYVEFAGEHAELFRLMFLFRPAAVDLVDEHGASVDNELDAASVAFDLGAADLQRAIDDGDLVDGDVVHLAMILWTAIHGVATVALTAPAVAADVAEDVIDTVLAGLRP